MRLVKCLFFFLFLLSPLSAYAADSLLCSDDDDNGIIDIVKAIGKVDRDCDGEASVADGGLDCDDTDGRIRNGLPTYAAYETAKAVCSAGEYRTCSSGTLSACTSAQFCERGTCYYVDAGSGSGSTCSFASPCASFAPLTLGGSISMGANTAIYLMGSTNLTVPTARTPDGGDAGAFIGFETEAAGTSAGSPNIIARYPTSTAKIDYGGSSYCDGAPSTSADQCAAMKLNHQYWWVRGFEMDSFYGTGVWSFGSNNQRISDNYIHDIECQEDNNCFAIKGHGGSDDLEIDHNIINDIGDPEENSAPGCGTSACDHQNVVGIGVFGDDATDVLVHHNIVGFSHAFGTTPYYKMGRCIWLKHANGSTVDPIEFYDNILYNCESFAIGGGSKKFYVYGNLMMDIAGSCIQSADPGGGDGYFVDDNQFYDNTCRTVNSGTTQAALSFSNAPTSGPSVKIQLKNNVVLDQNNTCAPTEDLLLGLYQYGADSLYTTIITGALFEMTDNEFYNSGCADGGTGFCIFCNAGAGASGSAVSHTNLQAAPATGYGLNAGGHFGSFTFNSSMQGSNNAASEGWERQWLGAGSTSTTTSTTSTTSTTTTSTSTTSTSATTTLPLSAGALASVLQ